MSTENEEVFDLGISLMEELSSIGRLDESFVNRQKAKDRLVTEATGDGGINDQNTYHYRGRPISWSRFKAVYTDYENFPTSADVMTALGFPLETFDKPDSMTRALNRIRKYFANHNREAHQIGIGQVQANERQKAYYLNPAQEAGDLPKASTDNINPGHRNRKTPSSKVLDMINDQNVMPGEFYNDISRIKRQKWGSWVRFWEKQMARIKNKKSLFGRVWQKTFIMGYQFDRRMFIEIWFNSATSSFSLYDQNGVEVGKPTETLQETIRYFVHHLVQYSEQDKEVFQRKGAATQVAQSSMRAMTQVLSKDATIASREAELASIEARGGAQPGIKAAVADGKAKMATWAEQNVKKHDEARRNRREEFTTDPWEMGTRGMNKAAKDRTDELKRKRDEREAEAAAAQKAAEEDYIRRTAERFGQKLKAKTIDGEYAVKDEKQSSLPHKGADKNAGNVKYDPFVNDNSGMGITPQQVERMKKVFDDKKRELEEKQAKLASLKAEEKDIKKNRKALGDRFDVLNRRNKVAQNQVESNIESVEDEMARLKKELEKQKKAKPAEPKSLPSPPNLKSVNEGVEDEMFDPSRSAEAISMATRELDQEAISRRKFAQNSPFTTASIKSSVMEDMVQTYDQTRAGSQARRPRNLLDKFFRGRKAPIVLPSEQAGIWDSLRMSLVGARYRADFVIGYSLRDEINIEIWYVTEPGEKGGVVSSFYVYDVTSAILVRSNLPYYRNAVQVVMAKIGVI